MGIPPIPGSKPSTPLFLPPGKSQKTNPSEVPSLPKSAQAPKQKLHKFTQLTSDPTEIIAQTEQYLNELNEHDKNLTKLFNDLEQLNVAIEKQNMDLCQKLEKAFINTKAPYDETFNFLDWLNQHVVPLIQTSSTHLNMKVPAIEKYNQVLQILSHLNHINTINEGFYIFLRLNVIKSAEKTLKQLKNKEMSAELSDWIKNQKVDLHKELKNYLIHTAPTLITITSSMTGVAFDVFKNTYFVMQHGKTVIESMNILWQLAFFLVSIWDLKEAGEKVDKHEKRAMGAYNIAKNVAVTSAWDNEWDLNEAAKNVTPKKVDKQENRALSFYNTAKYKAFAVTNENDAALKAQRKEKARTRLLESRKAAASLNHQKTIVQHALAKTRFKGAKIRFGLTILSVLATVTISALLIAGVITHATLISTGIGIPLSLIGFLVTGIIVYSYNRQKPNVHKTGFKVRLPLMFYSIFLAIHKARQAYVQLKMLSDTLKIEHTKNGSLSLDEKAFQSLIKNKKKLDSINEKISYWETKIAPLEKKILKAKWQDLLNNIYKDEKQFLITQALYSKSETLYSKSEILWIKDLEKITLNKIDKEQINRFKEILKIDNKTPQLTQKQKILLNDLLKKHNIQIDNSKSDIDNLNELELIKDLSKIDREQIERFRELLHTPAILPKKDKLLLFDLLAKYKLVKPIVVVDKEQKLWKDIFVEMVDSIFMNPNPEIGEETEHLFKWLGIDLNNFREQIKTEEGLSIAKTAIKNLLL